MYSYLFLHLAQFLNILIFINNFITISHLSHWLGPRSALEILVWRIWLYFYRLSRRIDFQSIWFDIILPLFFFSCWHQSMWKKRTMRQIVVSWYCITKRLILLFFLQFQRYPLWWNTHLCALLSDSFDSVTETDYLLLHL